MSHVNHEAKLVFIHVPKVAGTAISNSKLVGGGSGHAGADVLCVKHPEYFSFGFVRSPYDRLVSAFHAARQHAVKWQKLGDLTFGKFVEALRENENLIGPHTRSQWTFLCDKKGELLVDFVGRYERLAFDWHLLSDEPLKVRNNSKHQTWHTYYNPRLMQIVENVYAKDFELFGYEPLSGYVRQHRRPRNET